MPELDLCFRFKADKHYDLLCNLNQSSVLAILRKQLSKLDLGTIRNISVNVIHVRQNEL